MCLSEHRQQVCFYSGILSHDVCSKRQMTYFSASQCCSTLTILVLHSVSLQVASTGGGPQFLRAVIPLLEPRILPPAQHPVKVFKALHLSRVIFFTLLSVCKVLDLDTYVGKCHSVRPFGVCAHVSPVTQTSAPKIAHRALPR